jgi:hypothetical protein
MKTLQSVLTRYEQDRQKVIGSIEKHEETMVEELLAQYEGLTYNSILDKTSKAQVAFANNAQNLLDIEAKESKELQNLHMIKDALFVQDSILEDKSIILEETMVQKEQHLLNIKNLEEENLEEKNNLEKVHLIVGKDNKKCMDILDRMIESYTNAREERLKKEEELLSYEHQQTLQENEDKHNNAINIITKELEANERLHYKNIHKQQKELDDNAKEYEEATEYIENFDTQVADKVSTQSGIKMGFLKKEHENSIKADTNSFINQLDVLALELENKVESCQGKKSMIEALQDKLNSAKSNLNNLTQNTLTV